MNHEQKIKEKYCLELQDIQNDIEILKNKQLYEIQHLVGTPSCVTLGERLERKISDLLNKIDSDLPGSLEVTAEMLKK